MRSAVALAAAALVAAGFAALGGRIVGRSERRGLPAWNERFQVGAGAAALLSFPLSAIAGRFALPLLLVALGVLLLFDLPFRGGLSRRTLDGLRQEGSIAILLAAVLLFALLNARIGLVTDGLSVWAGKGKALFEDGAITERLSAPWFLGRYALYPPLVPLSIAAVGMLCGGVDAVSAKGFQPIFYGSLLVSVFVAARRIMSRKHALAAVLIVAFLPAVATDWNAGGFADLPLAALAAGAAAALLRPSPQEGWRSPAAWHLAALTTVKPEGAILAVIAALATATGTKSLRSAARRWRMAAVVGGALLMRALYVAWIALPDPTYGVLGSARLTQAARALPRVTSACAVAALNPKLWGLFWPAFLAAAIVIVVRGRPVERRLLAGVTLAVLLDGAIFLVSSWEDGRPAPGMRRDITEQVAIAYPRLLEQVAGVAAVVLVAGYGRLRPSHPSRVRDVNLP